MGSSFRMIATKGRMQSWIVKLGSRPRAKGWQGKTPFLTAAP
jgi:hypothetical protein